MFVLLFIILNHLKERERERKKNKEREKREYYQKS